MNETGTQSETRSHTFPSSSITRQITRVVGLFSGRGYIDSLTVSEVDPVSGYSKITIVTWGSESVINQIREQLRRLVPVQKVSDLTTDGRSVQRELALVKVNGTGEDRVDAIAVGINYRLRLWTVRLSLLCLRSWRSDTVDRFISEIMPLGLVDVSRTGIVAIARGAEEM